MEEYQREYPLFSACGLNCCLCPRFHTEGGSRCPGCGGEGFFEKRPSCGVISCCRRHDDLAYCYLCEEYPCKKYDRAMDYDSFITHRHMEKDFARAKAIGIDAYQAQLNEKVEILQTLLAQYNDGRRKSFFCLAVNLLELEDVKAAMAKIQAQTQDGMTAKEKSAMAAEALQELADSSGVELTLNRKKGKA